MDLPLPEYNKPKPLLPTYAVTEFIYMEGAEKGMTEYGHA